MTRKPENIQRNAFEESRNVLFRALRDLDGSSGQACIAVEALEDYLTTRATHEKEGTGDVVVPNPEHEDNAEMWEDHETYADARAQLMGEDEKDEEDDEDDEFADPDDE